MPRASGPVKDGPPPRAAWSGGAVRRAPRARVMSLLAAAIGSAYGQGVPLRELPSVVVTAQKREQAAPDVPVSLTPISGKDLEASGIDSAASLDQIAGLTVSAAGPGYLSITIRGISDLDGGLLGSPATGFYIDETPLSAFASQLPQVAYWDAERLEVLRGPQGTLFGEGSMGGTIRLITAKPDTTKPAARVMLGWSQVAGGGQGGTARLMVNVPLQRDVLALRLTASRQDIIGWVDVPELQAKDSNHGKTEDTRLALRWTPSRPLTVDLSYARQVLDSNDTPATSPGIYRPRDVNPGAQGPSFLSSQTSKYDLANVTVHYDFGPAALVGSVSRYERSSTARTDLTPYVPLVFGVGGTAERVIPLTIKATTTEWRLVSRGDERLNWTAGIYAKDDARKQTHAGLVISLPDLGLPRDETLYTTPARNRALALFGQAEFRLSSDWALQAGLRRYTARNHTSVRFDTTSAIFPGYTSGVVRDSGSSAHATSPMLGLSWTPRADLLVFAKLSSGFRDGDTNYQPGGYPEIPASYGPEKVRAYEVGLKARPLTWLSVNASVYQNHWTDLQLPFNTSDSLFTYLQNAGKATATGAEIEVVARPMPSLRLALNLAGVDARMDDNVLDASGHAGAVKGNRIPFSPRLQASVSAAREFELRSGLAAVVSARYARHGATYSEPSNQSILKNEAYNHLTLKAGVKGESWGARLSVGNATNSTASLQKAAAPAGDIVLTRHVQPRTVGVEIEASF